jgi:hypothetical protein
MHALPVRAGFRLTTVATVSFMVVLASGHLFSIAASYSLRRAARSKRARGNTLENMDESGMERVVAIFGHSCLSGPLKPVSGRTIPVDQREKKTPTSGSYLTSLHDPSDERPCRCAYGKRRRNRERKVPLKAMSCLIQELFARIAALLRGMPYGSYAILDRIGNRARCAGSLVSRFGDVVSRCLRYSL